MDPWLIALVAVGVVAFLVIAIVWGVRAHRRQVSAGMEDLVGQTAEVRTAIEPKGTVFVQGELWTAMSEEGRLESGEEVVITKVDRLRLWVARKAKLEER